MVSFSQIQQKMSPKEAGQVLEGSMVNKGPSGLKTPKGRGWGLRDINLLPLLDMRWISGDHKGLTLKAGKGAVHLHLRKSSKNSGTRKKTQRTILDKKDTSATPKYWEFASKEGGGERIVRFLGGKT